MRGGILQRIAIKNCFGEAVLTLFSLSDLKMWVARPLSLNNYIQPLPTTPLNIRKIILN